MIINISLRIYGQNDIPQEAQLSQRDRAMLHIIEHFVRSLKVLVALFLLASYSSYGPVLYHFRVSEILVENRDIFHTPAFESPLGGCRNVVVPFGVEIDWCGYPTVKKV